MSPKELDQAIQPAIKDFWRANPNSGGSSNIIYSLAENSAAAIFAAAPTAVDDCADLFCQQLRARIALLKRVMP